MKFIDLFSGIGGFSLGLENAGMSVVAHCEIEDYQNSILKKHWPDITVYRDIKDLKGEQYENKIDIVCGGFPCQPFSIAGKRRGKKDHRYLWPEMLRVIRESNPTWVIIENVNGFITMGLENLLTDLESQGFEVGTLIIPACAVGALHRRDRLWILGYAEHSGRNEPKIKNSRYQGSYCDKKGSEEVGKSTGSGCKIPLNKNLHGSGYAGIKNPTQPRVCGRDDGVSDRVVRLKALGNAVVPQIIELIAMGIMETNETVDA